jgi:hypothetical protein
MRDLHSRIKAVPAVNAVTSAGNAAQTAVTVDLQQGGVLAQSCEFIVNYGAKTDGAVAAVLNESDTGVFGGEETPVAAGDLLGTLAGIGAADGIAAANTVAKLGYRGSKRYLQLILTTSSNAGSCPLAAVAVLSHLGHNAAV